MIAIVNPDANLSETHLDLICDEVWSAFPECVVSQSKCPEVEHDAKSMEMADGLNLEGLEAIYAQGYADLDRDYGFVLNAMAEIERDISCEIEKNTKETVGEDDKNMDIVTTDINQISMEVASHVMLIDEGKESRWNSQMEKSGERGRNDEKSNSSSEMKSQNKTVGCTVDSDAAVSPQSEVASEITLGGHLKQEHDIHTGEPAVADASPCSANTSTPITNSNQNEAISKNILETPSGSDVFDAVKTPAPISNDTAADTTTGNASEENPEPWKKHCSTLLCSSRIDKFKYRDDPKTTVAFAIRHKSTPNDSLCISSSGGDTAFNNNWVKHEETLANALLQALPDTASFDIVIGIPTALGIVFGVVCYFDKTQNGPEEMEYFRAILEAEPEQIFEQTMFGSNSTVLIGNLGVVLSGELVAIACSETIAAGILAGNTGRGALSFAIYLPSITAQEFQKRKSSKFIQQLRKAIPSKSSARICQIIPEMHGGGVVIVVGASCIVATNADRLLVQKFTKAMLKSCSTIFDARAFGVPFAIAMQVSELVPVAIGMKIKVSVCDQTEAEEFLPKMISGIEEILPEGSSAGCINIRDSRNSSEGGVIIYFTSSLPIHIGGDEASSVASKVSKVSDWISDVALPSGTYAECLECGPALEIVGDARLPEEIAKADTMDGSCAEGCATPLHFGLGGGFGPGLVERSCSPTKRKNSPLKSNQKQCDKFQAASPQGKGLFRKLFHALSLKDTLTAQENDDNGGDAGEAFRARGDVCDTECNQPEPHMQDSIAMELEEGDLSAPDTRETTHPLDLGVDQAQLAAEALAGYQSRSPPCSESSNGQGNLVNNFSISNKCESDNEQVERRLNMDEAQAVSHEDSNMFKEGKFDQVLVPVIQVVAHAGPNSNVSGENFEQVNTCEIILDAEAEYEKGNEIARKELELTSILQLSKEAENTDDNESGSEQQNPSQDPTDIRAAAADANTVVGSAFLSDEKEQNQNREHIANQSISTDFQSRNMIENLEQILADPKAGTAEISPIQDSVSALPNFTQYSTHMEIGERLLAAGLYQEAMRSFQEATYLRPEDPLAKFRLGNVCFVLHLYREASKHFFSALKRCKPGDPLIVKIHINMGIALECDGNLKVAEREYLKASKLAPEHPRVQKLLGSVRCTLGEPEGAVEALNCALQLAPDFADAWADMGCAKAALGETAEAKKSFLRALECDPKHQEAHFNLANLLRQTGYPRQSLPHFNASISLDDNHWRSWLGKAVALGTLATSGDESKDTKRREKASQCLDRAVELSGAGDRALLEEVDRFRRLVAAQVAGEVLSEQADAIEKRVKTSLACSPALNNSVKSHLVREKSGIHSVNSSLPPAESQSGANNRSPSVSSIKIQRTRSARNLSLSPNKTPERLAGWKPQTDRIINVTDFSDEVLTKIKSMDIDIDKAISTLDIGLLQRLQPVTCVALSAIWEETRFVEACITSGRFKKLFETEDIPLSESCASEDTMSVHSRYTNRSRSQSPEKPLTKKSPKKSRPSSIVNYRSKAIPLAYAENIICRLVSKSAENRLEQLAINTLFGDVLTALIDQDNGTIDSSLLLCILAALADAPIRDRTSLTYKLLMWKQSEAPGSVETPATRETVVNVLATLKMIFEREHKFYDTKNRQLRATDSQFVLYERFMSDLTKFFPMYEVLPVLANPL